MYMFYSDIVCEAFSLSFSSGAWQCCTPRIQIAILTSALFLGSCIHNPGKSNVKPGEM
jgi:hypothetical protein